MNKKLLVAAVAAGLVIPGLATADVTVFGTIQAETGNIDIDTQGPGGDTDTTHMAGGSGAINGGGSNAVGLKGTEKLGNGLSVYFKWNNAFSTFDGGANMAARDRYVGFMGDGWHVQFGKMNSLYKASSAKYDPFLATGLQSRGVGAYSGAHNSYADDIMEVGFKSGGWSGGIQVTWEDSSGENNTAGGVRNVVDAGSWNAAIKYGANNWEAGFAYMDLEYKGAGTAATTPAGAPYSGTVTLYNTAGTTTVFGISGNVITGTVAVGAGTAAAAGAGGDADIWKVHGKWSGNGFTVMAQYEDMDANARAAAGGTARPDGAGTIAGTGGGAPGSAEGYDSLHIAVTYKFSDSTTLVGRFANTDWDDVAGVAGADVDGDHWAIGVVHNLSKRTHIYGGYMDNEYDYSGAAPDIDVDAWAIGMRHNF